MDNEAATLKTFDCKRCGRPLFTGEEFRVEIGGFEVTVLVKHALLRCVCGIAREWRGNERRKKRDGD